MSGRIWGYVALALAIGITTASMAAVDETAPRIFFAALLIAAVYATIAEANISTNRAISGPGAVNASQLPAGFGRAMLKQMPSPLLVIDQKGRVSYANPAAFAMMPRLQTGDHFATLFRAPAFVSAVTDTISTGETHSVTFATGAGQDRQFSAHIAPIPDGSDLGEDVQAIVQLDDRTEAHRLENMRTDFIANVSHELRTPLTAISGYIETLQTHAKDDVAAREKFLGIMQGQAGRMQRLVEDLMSLSRIEMNEHQKPEELCQPGQLAVDNVAALALLAKQYQSNLGVGPIDTATKVLGDRDQINQVITNLIENAMKYAGAGENVRVQSAAPDPRYPRMMGISIEDSGPGIAKEHLHRLTERFYRVSVSQSREKGGTGLGLAIVKHILNRHGGELEIASTLGEGSKFTIWLPIADRPVE